MRSIQDPPPPPLAADVAMSSLSCQLASENICVATSQILTLIRTLRLSILMMDTETILSEEELQLLETQSSTTKILEHAAQLEQDLMELRKQWLQ